MSKLSVNSLVLSPRNDDDDKDVQFSSQDSLNGRMHLLEIIQSPLRSAAFGSSYYSRLPLAPPLVVRLLVKNTDGKYIDIHDELPFYVCHASLLSEDGSKKLDFTQLNDEPESAPVRMLYGGLVTTPYVVRGEVVFPFTDLGVRLTGSDISSSTASETLSTAISDTFEIVDLDDYEAPAITNLSYELHSAGVPVQMPSQQHSI
ncbi:hypothetical protein E3Q22_02037 [Wallemia mellicola]|uniref:Velvet domain-containing protein n=1 Tax=Wallemia mellicola TaxID=1708541 RepID=A0A4T0MAY7_9BASI|nr:hypothetical protein E3Q22_02037 [Wallemia mellicola]